MIYGSGLGFGVGVGVSGSVGLYIIDQTLVKNQLSYFHFKLVYIYYYIFLKFTISLFQFYIQDSESNFKFNIYKINLIFNKINLEYVYFYFIN